MNLAPHYRAPLWRVLLNNPGWNMHFFYGDQANVLKTIDFEREAFSSNSEQIHKVKNYWWKGIVLFWQKGVVRECVKSQFEFAVFPGEMSKGSHCFLKKRFLVLHTNICFMREERKN